MLYLDINLVIGMHFSRTAVLCCLFKRDLTRDRYSERHSKFEFPGGAADYNDEQKLGFLRGGGLTDYSDEQ